MPIQEVVSLRSVGSDPANPTSGGLLGTATLPDPWSYPAAGESEPQRFPGDEPPLIRVINRLYMFAGSATEPDGSFRAQYIEIVPVEATPVP